MRSDNLYTGQKARSKLMAGIQKVADAVGATMGTGGSNAIIEAIENPGHLLTNDGYTIANSIVLSDAIEDMGRKILVESINRANKASGDGSSTTCVLTASIIEEGMKAMRGTGNVSAGGKIEMTGQVNAMEVKRSLEACIPLIEASIKAQTRVITDPSQIKQVASISAEDEEIGGRIAEIYEQIGKSGIIHWDISKTATDSYTIGTGITIEGAGWFSPYMCDATDSGQNTNRIRIANPYILVTKQKISTAGDFNNLAAALNAKEVKDLVVFCDDIDPLVTGDLIKTRALRGFRIIIVKMPVLWKDQWFEDLALATGAKVIDPIAGLAMKVATLEHLGRCGNILITKDDTFLDNIKDLSEHIDSLKMLKDVEMDNRAARLNTKTARYFVGAHSDSALSHRRLKVEDAISAAWQALNGGIVAGGGVALLNAARGMADNVGGNILRCALMSPIKQICKNAGIEPATFDAVDTQGFNTKTGNIVDMFEEGIVDPANVVLSAAKNAVSVAASVLTANTVVILPRQEMVDLSGLTQNAAML